MSDTPRTDAARISGQSAVYKLCEKLERELAAANALQKATHEEFMRATELIDEARVERDAANAALRDLTLELVDPEEWSRKHAAAIERAKAKKPAP